MSVWFHCPTCRAPRPSRVRVREAPAFPHVNTAVGTVLERCTLCGPSASGPADRFWKPRAELGRGRRRTR